MFIQAIVGFLLGAAVSAAEPPAPRAEPPVAAQQEQRVAGEDTTALNRGLLPLDTRAIIYVDPDGPDLRFEATRVPVALFYGALVAEGCEKLGNGYLECPGDALGDARMTALKIARLREERPGSSPRLSEKRVVRRKSAPVRSEDRTVRAAQPDAGAAARREAGDGRVDRNPAADEVPTPSREPAMGANPFRTAVEKIIVNRTKSKKLYEEYESMKREQASRKRRRKARAQAKAKAKARAAAEARAQAARNNAGRGPGSDRIDHRVAGGAEAGGRESVGRETDGDFVGSQAR